MSQHLTCIASSTAWKEDRSQTTTPRVTTAEVVLNFLPAPPTISDGHQTAAAPPVEGTTTTSYQMTYLPGGNASFIFTETVNASSFLGKQGTFVTQGRGDFEAASYAVTGTFGIVKGSGTGELQGLTGKGSFSPADTPGQLVYLFEVDLA